MGAHWFTDQAKGKTARDAYRAACDQATWEYGHDAYNGTISTTNGCVVIPNEPATYAKARHAFDRAIESAKRHHWSPAGIRELKRAKAKWHTKPGAKMTQPRFEKLMGETFVEIAEYFGVDKWGPAAAIDLTPRKKRDKVWGFMGWAAS